MTLLSGVHQRPQPSPVHAAHLNVSIPFAPVRDFRFNPEVSMRKTIRILLALATLAAAMPASTALAQQTSTLAAAYARQASTLTADLLADIGQVERKLVGLARAIPEEKFGWRPGEGVRSVSEVVMHVAADNYLIPAALGFAIDPSIGIKGDDYSTAQTFERRTVTKAQAIAELEKSFEYLRRTLGETTQARLGQSVQMFGQPLTMQKGWILATTHLHEHLGQLIAYARSNNVKPPGG